MLDVEIRKSDKKNIQILTLSGEFDFHEKERVLDLLPKLKSEDPKRLIIDLTGINLLVSAGVEALLVFHSAFEKAGGRVGVVIDHNNYLMCKFRNLGIFEGTGFELYETVEEAETAIGAK